jgi:glycosyltransferase involved in cell wall biosynthesis
MTDASPLVCICIPTYNAEHTIRETLASILNQSHSNLIVQLVDNASTDRTLEIVEAFDDKRIHIHRNGSNIGAEGNFNRCIQLATGKYTAIYHADDLYEPQMVERQVALLERAQRVGAVFTEATVIDQTGAPIGKLSVPVPSHLENGLYDFPTLFKSILKSSNFLICPSAMVRTEIYLNEIKCWQGDLFGSAADLDVWLRISQTHSIAILHQPLIRYRVSTTQSTHSLIRLRTERAEFFRVIDRYLDTPHVRDFLNNEDYMHFRWLERTDRVVRTANLFVLERFDEAAKLISQFNFPDALRAAVSNRRGLVTFFAGLYLYVVSVLGMHTFGRFTIRNLRRYIQK